MWSRTFRFVWGSISPGVSPHIWQVKPFLSKTSALSFVESLRPKLMSGRSGGIAVSMYSPDFRLALSLCVMIGQPASSRNSRTRRAHSLRESEIANIPFPAALAGALPRCSSLVWPATRHSSRLALHPAITTKNGTFAISDSLTSGPTASRSSNDETILPTFASRNDLIFAFELGLRSVTATSQWFAQFAKSA